MQQTFVMIKKGFALADPDEYVVRGCFTDNFRKDRFFRAFYGTEELPVRMRMREGVEVYKRYQSLDNGNTYVDREYFLSIKLPKKQERANRLRIFECRGKECVLLYQATDRALKKERQRLICYIDGGHFLNEEEKQNFKQAADGKLAVISGWAVCARPFSVEVRNSAGEVLKSRTETCFRGDIVKEYPEFFRWETQEKEQLLCGFRTVFEASEGKIAVTVTDGLSSKETVVKLSADAFVPKRQVTFDELRWKLCGGRGLSAAVKHCLHKGTPLPSDVHAVAPPDYGTWRVQTEQIRQQGQAEQRKSSGDAPLFSVVVPLYLTQQEHLRELIASIQKQNFTDWELCLSDGGGAQSQLGGYLKELCGRDARIHVVTSGQKLGISENTNAALAIASGRYVVFADHDDLLHPQALAECAKRIEKQPDIDLIYTDEDKISMDGKEHFQPHFKPDYNKELLRSMNYFCHLVVVKRSLLQKVGNLDTNFDGAQDYDFVLRCIEQAVNICHIPKVLYHWRAHRDSTAENPESKRYAFEAGVRALDAHYGRCGIPAKAESADVPGMYRISWQMPGNTPMISIILHGADAQKTDTEKIRADYPNLEVICVKGTSAAALNAAAEKANGELLLFLDRNMAAAPESLLKMAGFCLQKDVAAAGPRVEYTDGIIRQCGVIFDKEGMLYRAFEGLAKDEPGYFARTKSAMDVSVLLSEAMMVRRSVFEALDGFDIRLENGYYDADFCLRAKKKGFRSIYCPEAVFHLSPASQETDVDKERQLFVKRWKKALEMGDPNYNPNLCVRRADCSLRCIYSVPS